MGRPRSEVAAQWCRIAGELTEDFPISILNSNRLELVLNKIGKATCASIDIKRKREGRNDVRWLHVISRTARGGGHTALCRRWIQADKSNDQHHLALTFQESTDIDPELVDEVKTRGGAINYVSQKYSLLERAIQLNKIAAEFDVVVLHIHMWDPVPSIAFAQPGGPPVLMMNHADHVYWTGSSVADVVLNIRPSGEALCLPYRGCHKTFRLPVPLPLPTTSEGERDELRKSLRLTLGIPSDAIVYLTIGSAYKYAPIQELNFLETTETLLERVSNSYLIAVGPNIDDPMWQALAERTGGRVKAFGFQPELTSFLAAADVYLEGFPFGSLTALLEAALFGLPPVLAPAACPLPYRSDDFGLVKVTAPENVAAYIFKAILLASDQTERQRLGQQVRFSTQLHHCGEAWEKYVVLLRQMVLNEVQHLPDGNAAAEPLPDHLISYWNHFCAKRTRDNPVSFAMRRCMRYGLRPWIDIKVLVGLINAKSKHVRSPNILTVAFGGTFLSLLPKSLSRRIYLGKQQKN